VYRWIQFVLNVHAVRNVGGGAADYRRRSCGRAPHLSARCAACGGADWVCWWSEGGERRALCAAFPELGCSRSDCQSASQRNRRAPKRANQTNRARTVFRGPRPAITVTVQYGTVSSLLTVQHVLEDALVVCTCL
jgi:hypothetical protein